MSQDTVILVAVVVVSGLAVWLVWRMIDRRVWRAHLPLPKQEKIIRRRFARAKHDVIVREDQFSVNTARLDEIARRHGYAFVLEGEVRYARSGTVVTRTPTYVYRSHTNGT